MKRQLIATASHILGNLSVELYSPEQSLAELFRNSMVASMPNGSWDPKKAEIEIWLEKKHPMVGDEALVFLDHGSGLTEAALERYFNWLGTPLSRLRDAYSGNGASQKNIGRLAALALNRNCIEGDILDRVSHGYYILTRTNPRGDARYISFIPRKVEDEGGVDTDHFVAPTSVEMRGLNHIVGPFTAIIVPTPIFENYAEIKESIKWILPRESTKMCKLSIGGHPFSPPPLENKISVSTEDLQFRARLGVANSDCKDENLHGAWLCDSATGFRVASCEQIGRMLPDPLWSPELIGDIFAPDLLRSQNTARSGLNREFFRKSNKAWTKLYMWLIREVAPKADELIRRDSITGDAADTLSDIVEMFNDSFGPPEKRIRETPPGGPIDKPTGTGTTGTPRQPGEKHERHVSVKINDETYMLYKGKTLPPHLFAEISPNNDKTVYVNVRGGYAALPKTKATRLEHCLMQILQAVAHSKYPHDSREATIFANQVRSKFKR